MLLWTPRMWHMRAQRRHAKFTIKDKSALIKPEKQEPNNTEQLAFDDIQHKRHFPNSAKSHGLRAYFGYN